MAKRQVLPWENLVGRWAYLMQDPKCRTCPWRQLEAGVRHRAWFPAVMKGYQFTGGQVEEGYPGGRDTRAWGAGVHALVMLEPGLCMARGSNTEKGTPGCLIT